MAKYRPRHDTQYEPREPDSPLNCNMAAAADVARFWSLGLKDFNHHQMRNRAENPDGSPDNVGGTTIEQAAEVLDDIGIDTNYKDLNDGATWGDVVTRLKGDGILIIHGDYGEVPYNLRGEISRTFTGLHSVVGHSFVDGMQNVWIGDGLSDDWVKWPYAVVQRYMAAFPGSFTYLVARPRKLKVKAPREFANVRLTPSREFAPYDRIKPDERIHVGGRVIGQRAQSNGNRTWYRVWHLNRIGYIHTNVGEIVGAG